MYRSSAVFISHVELVKATFEALLHEASKPLRLICFETCIKMLKSCDFSKRCFVTS